MSTDMAAATQLAKQNVRARSRMLAAWWGTRSFGWRHRCSAGTSLSRFQSEQVAIRPIVIPAQTGAMLSGKFDPIARQEAPPCRRHHTTQPAPRINGSSGFGTEWNLYFAHVIPSACHAQVHRAMSPSHTSTRAITANTPRDAVQETNNALLHATGLIVGERVLVIGQDPPDLVANLACRGAAEITLLGRTAQPEPATVDVAVVTGIACVGYARRAVETACHALSLSGRIVLQSAAEVDDDLGECIARTLREAGFSGLRLQVSGGRVIASAYRLRLGAQRST